MPRLDHFEALGRHVAREEEALVGDPGEHERLRARVRDAAANPRRRSTEARAVRALLSAAAVLAVTAAFFVLRREPLPLSFYVGPAGAPGIVGSWMSASDEASLPVRFSDGTRVSLFSHARGRVVSLSAFGADVVVEAGRARFDVVPKARSQWRVSTGPFVVQVTGTRFEVEWRPEADAFGIDVHEGHVRVSGCALPEGYPVRAGQRFEASCRKKDFHVSPIVRATEGDDVAEHRAAASVPAHATAAPAIAEPAETSRPAEPAPGASQAPDPGRVVIPESWLELAEQGRYAEAFALAEEAGFEREQEHRNAREVLLLADLARFTGHSSRAQVAYQAVRRRFAGTTSAALAAFQLGRDELDRQGDPASAERWLGTYLEEAPGGSLAPAAMGRLMEAQVRLGKLGQAKEVARRYLDRYPKGPHADAAKRVLRAAPDDASP